MLVWTVQQIFVTGTQPGLESDPVTWFTRNLEWNIY